MWRDVCSHVAHSIKFIVSKLHKDFSTNSFDIYAILLRLSHEDVAGTEVVCVTPSYNGSVFNV